MKNLKIMLSRQDKPINLTIWNKKEAALGTEFGNKVGIANLRINTFESDLDFSGSQCKYRTKGRVKNISLSIDYEITEPVPKLLTDLQPN